MNNEADLLIDFFNFNDNDVLSKLSKNSLKKLLELLKSYSLKMRKNIDISDDTFGIELECEDAEIEKIQIFISTFYPDWCYTFDPSLKDGIEVKTPILKNSDKTWVDLLNVNEYMGKNSYIGENSSIHVHIDKSILEDNPLFLYRFLKLWACYEHIIYRFLYGEFNSLRPMGDYFANSIKELIYEDIRNYDINLGSGSKPGIYDLLRLLQFDRNQVINFNNIARFDNDLTKFNTYEFRGANGTFSTVIIQNIINLYMNMFMYSKSDKYDEEFINKKFLESRAIEFNKENYSKIYMDDALEFCDLIFYKNIDKIYFLRQYIKDNEENQEYKKCRSFTL